jgi:hypothetical protein
MNKIEESRSLAALISRKPPKHALLAAVEVFLRFLENAACFLPFSVMQYGMKKLPIGLAEVPSRSGFSGNISRAAVPIGLRR